MKDPCDGCQKAWAKPDDSCNNHCMTFVSYLVRLIDLKCDELNKNVTAIVEQKECQ